MSPRRVAVLGGGPAGLAAADAALRAGATVVLIDEAEQPGGQYWRHREGLTDTKLQHDWRRFEKLRDTVRGAVAAGRASVLQRAAVWRIETAECIRLHTLVGDVDAPGRHRARVGVDALVLATGAHDRALPIPGWTLPGVTTAGAAQALAKRDGVAMGRRTLVAGAGPFLLPAATSLLTIGASVAEVVEASRASRLARGWGAKPWQLASVPNKARELAGYVVALAKHRVPYRTGQGVVRILGDDRVKGAVVARLDDAWRPIVGTEREISCDAVALGHGFAPRVDAAIQAGCALSVAPAGRSRFVIVDALQRTNVPHVFAAGEITGIGGADAAVAEGAVAGFAAAGAARELLKPALRTRARAASFAARIEAAHGIRDGWQSWLDDDTLVCRCESVEVATIRAASGLPSRAGRLWTRAGLGACQGRTCGASVEAICGERLGLDARPVLSPMRIGELAAKQETGRLTDP